MQKGDAVDCRPMRDRSAGVRSAETLTCSTGRLVKADLLELLQKLLELFPRLSPSLKLDDKRNNDGELRERISEMAVTKRKMSDLAPPEHEQSFPSDYLCTGSRSR